jgi:hypothetical protein
MGTVIEAEGVRIFINARDHGPPHAHVRGSDWELRVYIGDRAKLWNVKHGKPNSKEVRRAVELVAANLDGCNAEWRRIYG